MADGFIVRRGGKAEEVLRTAVPTINFVSKTSQTITVTFTNNDSGEVEIYYGLTAPLTDTVILATNTTSSNITFSGLADDTTFTISAYAIVTDTTLKKIKSEVVSTNVTTNPLIFTAATGGTILEYNETNSPTKRYRSHTFTSNGDFVVTQVGDDEDDRNKVDYLIVAGGGAGGSGSSNARGGSGGGAGGFLTTLGATSSNVANEAKVTVTTQTYAVVIGGGGAANNNGSNSSAFGITSTGGGKGGGGGAGGVSNGGSGGGGGINELTGGTGIVGQGRNGGPGTSSTSGFSGAGGGGAGAVGIRSLTPASGLSNALQTGSNQTYSIGGPGAYGWSNRAGIPGASNTGNGGEGGGGNNAPSGGQSGGNGGSGIVVIRYEIAPSV